MSVTSLAKSGLFTVREVAERDSLSVTTVRKLIGAGQLKARQIGRCVRIHLEDLEEWERTLPVKDVSA